MATCECYNMADYVCLSCHNKVVEQVQRYQKYRSKAKTGKAFAKIFEDAEKYPEYWQEVCDIADGELAEAQKEIDRLTDELQLLTQTIQDQRRNQ